MIYLSLSIVLSWTSCLPFDLLYLFLRHLFLLFAVLRVLLSFLLLSLLLILYSILRCTLLLFMLPLFQYRALFLNLSTTRIYYLSDWLLFGWYRNCHNFRSVYKFFLGLKAIPENRRARNTFNFFLMLGNFILVNGIIIFFKSLELVRKG